MHRHLRQLDRVHAFPARGRGIAPRLAGAFTLVELLVAMAIFSILAVLAVSAFRGNDSDRISAATGTVRNAIEGARSRAIKSGQVRGLRLITDPNDPRIVTSMIYVGAPDTGYDEGTGKVVGSTDPMTNSVTWKFTTNSGDWSTLSLRGLLSVPTRIEIPKDSGHWYSATALIGNTVTFAGHFQPSQWNTTIGWSPVPTSTALANESQSIPYRIELSPAILPGAEPTNLPRGTCIDLDGSVIPTSWFNGNYAATMDILFSPRGDLVGPVKTAGILHLRIASSADQKLFQLNGYTRSDSSISVINANPEKGHKAISVFGQTGGVVISEIDTSSVSLPNVNDSTVTVPSAAAYKYAIRGKEAK